jgi:hypothetical protein
MNGIAYSSEPAFCRKKGSKQKKEKIVPIKDEALFPKNRAVLYEKTTETHMKMISVIHTPLSLPNTNPGTLIKYVSGPLLSKKSR